MRLLRLSTGVYRGLPSPINVSQRYIADPMIRPHFPGLFVDAPTELYLFLSPICCKCGWCTMIDTFSNLRPPFSAFQPHFEKASLATGDRSIGSRRLFATAICSNLQGWSLRNRLPTDLKRYFMMINLLRDGGRHSAYASGHLILSPVATIPSFFAKVDVAAFSNRPACVEMARIINGSTFESVRNRFSPHSTPIVCPVCNAPDRRRFGQLQIGGTYQPSTRRVNPRAVCIVLQSAGRPKAKFAVRRTRFDPSCGRATFTVGMREGVITL